MAITLVLNLLFKGLALMEPFDLESIRSIYDHFAKPNFEEVLDCDTVKMAITTNKQQLTILEFKISPSQDLCLTSLTSEETHDDRYSVAISIHSKTQNALAHMVESFSLESFRTQLVCEDIPGVDFACRSVFSDTAVSATLGSLFITVRGGEGYATILERLALSLRSYHLE